MTGTEIFPELSHSKSNSRSGAKLIDVRALTKRYGARTVVDEVSLSVRAGEVVGLLGPNGAGKTTTFYMVVGLVRPNGGQVLLSADDGTGTDITHQPIHVRAREGIGYLAQETSVFRRLSVADNLRLIWEQRGVDEHEQERRLPLLLEEFGLEALAGSVAETLMTSRSPGSRRSGRSRNIRCAIVPLERCATSSLTLSRGSGGSCASSAAGSLNASADIFGSVSAARQRAGDQLE